ncbi:MAG: EAL domain-containing protein [Candidatus Eremiobacteraeota bacterium]|nr:EAL domain-containing protein [Candidatus Eremiobacteraeota bacterium]
MPTGAGHLNLSAFWNGVHTDNQLERLLEITRDIMQADDLNVALDSIARGVRDLFFFRYVTIVVADADSDDNMRRAVLLGYPKEVVEERLNEPIARSDVLAILPRANRMFENCYYIPAEGDLLWARSIYTGDLPLDAPRGQENEWHERDALILTLTDKDGTMIGYLSIDGPKDNKIPSVDTLRTMQIYVNLVGLSLANARARNRLQYEATHDSLTQLPNRKMFAMKLRKALDIVCAKTSQGTYTVLFIDLDEFKSINDSLGHWAGDEALIAVANRLKGVVGRAHIVARMGGDEFAVLLRNMESLRAVDEVIERIQHALRQPLTIRGCVLFTTGSIGIAIVRPFYERIENIMRDADTAMYHAKTLGRAQKAYFNERMHTHASRRFTLSTALQLAVERRQFSLAYQPIVAISSRRIVALEALVRWEHPTDGLIMPGEFIPLAEEVGLIVPIGRHVIETACAQLAQWREIDSSLSMNINLAVQEVLQPDLPAFLATVLDHHGLQPSDLTLEITEGSILHSEMYASGVLERLRGLGYRLCIDDFGAGYSSLRYVQQFPFNCLKIDKSFIDGLDGELIGAPIVRMLIELGESYGITVIAEGVQTERQAAALEDLRCGFGQGNYLSSPLDCDDIGRLLANQIKQLAPSLANV